MYRANHQLLPTIFQNYFIDIKDTDDHFTRGIRFVSLSHQNQLYKILDQVYRAGPLGLFAKTC